jgi:hypothetical protein
MIVNDAGNTRGNLIKKLLLVVCVEKTKLRYERPEL